MNLEAELNEFLQDPKNKERLMGAALEAMEARVTEQFKWNLPDTIAKECNDFISEHVAPEIRAHLLSQKGVIVEAAKAAADQVGEKIADAMVAKVEGNLDTTWGASKIVKGLFE